MFYEVGGAFEMGKGFPDNTQGSPQRLDRFVRRNDAFLHHAVQDIDLSSLRLFRVSERRGTAGGLNQTREERRLRKIQFVHRFAEVIFCRRRNPVRPVAQVDLVQIKKQNFFLRQVLLNLEGEDGLPELSRITPFGRE